MLKKARCQLYFEDNLYYSNQVKPYLKVLENFGLILER